MRRHGVDAGQDPAPVDFQTRSAALINKYTGWLRREEAALPASRKLQRTLAKLYRSKGERYQMSDYYKAEFAIDIASPAVSKAG